MPELTKMVSDYLEGAGITVQDVIGLEVVDNLQVGRLDPQRLPEIAARLNSDGVDAIVLSACVQMPSLAAIQTVEDRLGLPVITAATATTYEILKALGHEPAIRGAGALLAGNRRPAEAAPQPSTCCPTERTANTEHRQVNPAPGPCPPHQTNGVMMSVQEVTREQAVRHATVASVVGTTIEWYDFFLYGTAAALVFPQLFFPGQSAFAGVLAASAPSSWALWRVPSVPPSSGTSVTGSAARPR